MASNESDPAAKDGAGCNQFSTADAAGHNENSLKKQEQAEQKACSLEGPIHLIAGDNGLPEIRLQVCNGIARVRVANAPWGWRGAAYQEFILGPSGRPGRGCLGYIAKVKEAFEAEARKAEEKRELIAAARGAFRRDIATLMRAAAGLVLLNLAVLWVLFGSALFSSPAEAEERFSCTVASITDGDTLRCAERGSDGRAIRVRLSGIAARERDNSCSPGHPCPDASSEASTTALERLAAGEELSCRAVGTTYGRVAAFCENGSGVDLSCAMVQGGYAAKWDRYWGAHRCP